MLIPVHHKLVLTIYRCGPDCLELGSIAQCREQRIGIESRIRTVSILDRLSEQPQRNLMSTAECFDLRCRIANFRVRKREATRANGEFVNLSRGAFLKASLS